MKFWENHSNNCPIFLNNKILFFQIIQFLPSSTYFYLIFLDIDLRSLRAIRIIRLFRLAKLIRYVKALDDIGRTLKEKAPDILTALILIGILIFISSTLIYYAERDAQPDVFSSIPASMWWAVSTLTTVGYGDIYPVTGVGKLLGSIVAILGISAFAIPTAILSSAFRKKD